MWYQVSIILVCACVVLSIVWCTYNFSVGQKFLGVMWACIASFNLWNLCNLVLKEAMKGIK